MSKLAQVFVVVAIIAVLLLSAYNAIQVTKMGNAVERPVKPGVVRHFEAMLHNERGDTMKFWTDVEKGDDWSASKYKEECDKEIAEMFATAAARGYH